MFKASPSGHDVPVTFEGNRTDVLPNLQPLRGAVHFTVLTFSKAAQGAKYHTEDDMQASAPSSNRPDWGWLNKLQTKADFCVSDKLKDQASTRSSYGYGTVLSPENESKSVLCPQK